MTRKQAQAEVNAKWKTIGKAARKTPAVRHLLNLYVKHRGICYYCGKKCVFAQDGTGGSHPDTATIEHLYCKDDIRRMMLPKWSHLVLSCRACNKESNERFRSEQIYPYRNVTDHPWLVGIAAQRLKENDNNYE